MTAKTWTRVGFISGNALRQILVSLFGMAIPLLVIQFASKEIWGIFVSFLLFTLLAVQIINWGNKEYLLRAFSLRPNQIMQDYSRVLFTRFPMVFVAVAISLIYFRVQEVLWIFLWLFGRFLSHSFEALVIYQKTFGGAIAVEVVCFMTFCGAFLYLPFTLGYLLMAYSSYQLLKGLLYFLWFARYFSMPDSRFDLSYYKLGLPFFLLSILGFLASKADVYLIENLGNQTVTADYQVINSLLVFTMSLAAFIYAPFTKNLYRNNEMVIAKTKKILSLLGLIMVPAALVGIATILHYFLQLELSIYFYLIAFVYIYPSYVYGIEVVDLFRRHREKTVVKYLFVGAAANVALSSVFLSLGFGMTGALAGSAIAQIIVLLLFKLKTSF